MDVLVNIYTQGIIPFVNVNNTSNPLTMLVSSRVYNLLKIRGFNICLYSEDPNMKHLDEKKKNEEYEDIKNIIDNSLDNEEEVLVDESVLSGNPIEEEDEIDKMIKESAMNTPEPEVTKDETVYTEAKLLQMGRRDLDKILTDLGGVTRYHDKTRVVIDKILKIQEENK